jgi:hypothetical protein
MERPMALRVLLDLFYDYRTNVALYPKWQQFLRDRQPKTIIFWGQDDVFFSRERGEAYLKDLPQAEMHRLDSGHFAVGGLPGRNREQHVALLSRESCCRQAVEPSRLACQIEGSPAFYPIVASRFHKFR